MVRIPLAHPVEEALNPPDPPAGEAVLQLHLSFGWQLHKDLSVLISGSCMQLAWLWWSGIHPSIHPSVCLLVRLSVLLSILSLVHSFLHPTPGSGNSQQ